MTMVNESLRRRDIIIVGSAVVPYDFAILNETDIKVIQDGILLNLDQYVVTGVGSDAGGTVILATAPADGTHVVLLGKQAIKQMSGYTIEAFPPERIQNDFNKAAIASQQLAEQLRRALLFSESSLNASVTLPDPSAIDLFLRITSLNPLTVGWGTLAALAGAVGIPLAFTNGGTGASYASADALALGLKLARWASLALTPVAGVLTLPNPLTGNYVLVDVGDVSSISTAGVNIGTVLRLVYAGSNTLVDSSGLQLQGRSNYVTVANDISVMLFDGTSWIEIDRLPALSIGNLGKFKKGDGTWGTIPAQTLRTGIGSGLTGSNNASDATNDIDVAAGDAVSDEADPTLRRSMYSNSVFVKQLDTTWAPGSAAGGRVTGQALADGTWHCFIFQRSAGAIDFCFSNALSFTTPDGGSHRLRIFSFLRESGAIVPFIQLGRRFLRKAPVKSFDANVTTSQQLSLALVPTGLSVASILQVYLNVASFAYFHSPDVTDLAASVSVAPGPTIGTASGANAFQIEVDTNTAGQVAFRGTVTGAMRIFSVGWVDVALQTTYGG